MHLVIRFFLFVLCSGIVCVSKAQTVDTTVAREILAAKDTLRLPAENNPVFTETDSAKLKNPKSKKPGGAALRSAILPGWGQVYNKKIWKVPIVYGALGGTGAYFLYNLKWYKNFRDAVRIVDDLAKSSEPRDSTAYLGMERNLRLWYERNGIESLRFFRDDTRKKVDYSALYFILAWALNVVDATVDGHLNQFDISPDLTFKIQPGYSEMARTSGVSFVLHIK